MSIPIVELLGVKIHNVASVELNEEIGRLIRAGEQHIIANVNINAMNIAYEQKWFKDFLNAATINFCDGDGVRLGARLKGHLIKEKITYNRWIWDFSKYCDEHGFSYYLIGSNQETIEHSAQVLKQKYPNLEIAGWRNGFFNNEEEIEACIQEINDAQPNVLLMGMGMPHQERWLMKNMRRTNFNIALTGGAVFEYVSGNAAMTPDILYKLKLEWFYRFLQEPKRLFRRYIIGNPLFLLRVLFSK